MCKLSQSIFICRIVIRGWLLFSLILSTGQTASAQIQIPSAVQIIDVIDDTVANVLLPSGFLLSGTVTRERGEPIGLGTVTAQSSTDDYRGNISVEGAAPVYRIALPAGTYDLNLSIPFLDSDADVPTLIHVASAVATALPIAADTTQNLIIPALPSLVTVTGLVTTPDTLPTAGGLQFVSADSNIFTIASFAGEYIARLPLATYGVNAELTFTEVSVPSDGAMAPMRRRTTSSVVINLDPVTVTGEPTIHDVTLPPTVRLSGIVSDPFGVPISPARAMASVSEAGSPTLSSIDFSCRTRMTFSFVPIPISGTAIIHGDTLQGEPNTVGDYSMPLPSETYRLRVALGFELQPGMAPTPVSIDTSPRGILYVAAPGAGLALTTDTTQNLTVPALPPVVTLAGQVTDTLGQPVANASVRAMTSSLTGISEATFVATAQTRVDGTYSLPVFSGSGYRVMACPPHPIALDQ